MPSIFPSAQWVADLEQTINSDERYAEIGKKWEGDLIFRIHPGGALKQETCIYVDLFQGVCRQADLLGVGETRPAAFELTGDYENFERVLSGDLDPMQAMMTKKLQVKGSMAYILKNVPAVLEFVRCAQAATASFLAE